MDQAISYSDCVIYSNFGAGLLCKTTNYNVINKAHWLGQIFSGLLWCGGTPQQAIWVSILQQKVLLTWGTSFTFPVWLGQRNNFLAYLLWLHLLLNFFSSRIQVEEKPYDFYYFTTPAKKRLTDYICHDYIPAHKNFFAHNELREKN